MPQHPPTPCLLCLADCDGDAMLCNACIVELPALGAHCPRCSEPLQTSALCPRCLHQAPPISRVVCIGAYRWPLAELIQRFKFGRDLANGRGLAQLLSEAAKILPIEERPDLLLPMPLHWRRRWQRSFNQAAELTIQVGKQLAIPTDLTLLRRRVATPSQARLSAVQRRQNLRNAFEVTNPSVLRNQRIAVVDDVMTTGSSIYCIAQLLKDAGAAEVQAWVAARAGRVQ